MPQIELLAVPYRAPRAITWLHDHMIILVCAVIMLLSCIFLSEIQQVKQEIGSAKYKKKLPRKIMLPLHSECTVNISVLEMVYGVLPRTAISCSILHFQLLLEMSSSLRCSNPISQGREDFHKILAAFGPWKTSHVARHMRIESHLKWTHKCSQWMSKLNEQNAYHIVMRQIA